MLTLHFLLTDFVTYGLFILGGLFAGALNTLAGYGSIITLSLLIELGGLSPNMANGTNRIGVLSNSIAGAWGFHKHGKLNLRQAWPFILIAFIGAIPGVYLATIISNEEFRNVFRFLVFTLFFFMLSKPKNWLIKETMLTNPNWLINIPVFLLIGFYGGFIQFGLGLFILAALVLVNKIEIIEANAIKLAIIAAYSIMAIAVFHFKGLIDWQYGLILGFGQATGSYFTAKYASKNEGVRIWAFRLLIIIVIIIISRELYLLYQEFYG